MTRGRRWIEAAPWIDAIAGLFFPNTCQLCFAERATAADGFVGSECRRGVVPISAPFCQRCGLPYDGDVETEFVCANCADVKLHFEAARAAVVASGPVRDAIHRYKYRNAPWFETFLGDLLIQAAAGDPLVDRCDALIPVPLHPVRRRERGFNQAERLAVRLGAAARKPAWTNVIHRVAETHTQTTLTRDDRRANMSGAFQPGDRRIDGASVVLIDDILTTGATTNAAALALRKAGAKGVGVWTVARAPKHAR
jgi:competence protein ComFC